MPSRFRPPAWRRFPVNVCEADDPDLPGGGVADAGERPVVPPHRIEDIILAQAREKAVALVKTASKHMALESQNLPDAKIAQEIERLTREIASEMPPDFWTSK